MKSKPEFISGWYKGDENSIISKQEFGEPYIDYYTKRPSLDKDGNIIKYLTCGPIKNVPTNRKITGKFVLSSIITGRSSKQIILKNIDTGEKFPLFCGDLTELLKDCVFNLTLEPCKRGNTIAFRKAK